MRKGILTVLVLGMGTGLATCLWYQKAVEDQELQKADLGKQEPASAVKKLSREEEIVERANIGTDDRSLLEYLRNCSQIEKLVAHLGSPKFQEREEASKDLQRIGIAAFYALQKARHDPDLEIARRAQACLARIEEDLRGERFWAGVPLAVVRVLLQSRPRGTTEGLLRYLAQLNDMELARQEDDQATLAKAPPEAQLEVSRQCAFNDPKSFVVRSRLKAIRKEAQAVLASWAVRDGKLDPAFAAALTDKWPALRQQAAIVLGSLGPNAEPAVPALIEALQYFGDFKAKTHSVNGMWVEYRVLVISGYGPEDAIRDIGKPALLYLKKAVKDKRAKVRWAAVMMAAQLSRDDPKQEIALARQAFQDEDIRVRCMGLSPLALIAEHNEEAFGILLEMIGDRDSRKNMTTTTLSDEAAFVLRGLARRKKNVQVSHLVKFLKDTNGNVRTNAARILSDVGPQAKDAVPDLLEIVKDTALDSSRDGTQLRICAIGALGTIGPAAESAVPALKTALSDRNATIRARAAEALKSIQPRSQN